MRGFTLFEIAISLLILSAAVIALMLVFPVGIKAQQMARFQVYANTKVLEMVDTFSNHAHNWFDVQQEAERPGQNSFMSVVPLDLDRMMSSSELGLLPLPISIARRLDSDNDEIAKVLDAGGLLYFVRAASCGIL